MKNAQFGFDQFSAMMRRRKIPFLIPFIIIFAACTVGAFIMQKKYKSSTTILVQGDGVLNPLVSYTMAVTMAYDGQLHNFDEIIYSRPVIEALIDSLGLHKQEETAAQKEALIAAITKSITTDRKGTDIFTISYFAPTPEMAQRGVEVLSELYIRKRLTIQNSKNDFAVQFFTQRLNSLRNKFEKSQNQLVGMMKQHISAIPESDRELYTQIGDYNKQIDKIQSTISNYQQALAILNKTDLAHPKTIDLKTLYEIPLLGVPYGKELESALVQYDGLLHKYTEHYPAVEDAKANLLQLLQRSRSVTQSGLVAKENQIWQIEKSRNKEIATVQRATVASSQDQDVRSNFNIYKGLYNDMQVKLEQAETSRALGENGAREFVVLDPPALPTRPAKPNKPLMVGAGLILGLILGLLSAGLAEIFDSRVRTPMDIDLYNKPVIAFLPAVDGYSKHAD